jgi:hypothetical protein
MAINAKLQTLINIKNDIGTAITNKGGTITGETPFFNYAAQIDGISTGTPQTIFAASNGSKWARTNAVNLTNVSNNVTSDFNWWQPANNSTSDPILNVGTVGANISGNIRLVPVNQVNIAQYSNIVAQDNNGAKYVGYNGFDQITNPTPTGNTTFNRWLLNNSATGTVIFANATIVNGGIYNGPNASINEANMVFINNTNVYGGDVLSVVINNGLIYAGGGVSNFISRYNESTLLWTGSSGTYGNIIKSMAINNGSIYVGGGVISGGNRGVRKYRESDFVIEANAANFGEINAVAVNNGFVYASSDSRLRKYHESNLVLSLNSGTTFDSGNSIVTNNTFVYLASGTIVRKFNESDLGFVGNTADYGGPIMTITTNNGFIYVGGFTTQQVRKYHESNLAFVGNTSLYNGTIIYSVITNNGFIYAGGQNSIQNNQVVEKYFESNLAFVGKTANLGERQIRSMDSNNGFFYVGGGFGNRAVHKFQERGLITDNQTFYNISKIKE